MSARAATKTRSVTINNLSRQASGLGLVGGHGTVAINRAVRGASWTCRAPNRPPCPGPGRRARPVRPRRYRGS